MHFRFYLIQDIHCPKLESGSNNAVISIQLLDSPLGPRKRESLENTLIWLWLYLYPAHFLIKLTLNVASRQPLHYSSVLAEIAIH